MIDAAVYACVFCLNLGFALGLLWGRAVCNRRIETRDRHIAVLQEQLQSQALEHATYLAASAPKQELHS